MPEKFCAEVVGFNCEGTNAQYHWNTIGVESENKKLTYWGVHISYPLKRYTEKYSGNGKWCKSNDEIHHLTHCILSLVQAKNRNLLVQFTTIGQLLVNVL